MPQLPLVGNAAHELGQRERIALGVAIEKGQEFAPDFLMIQRGHEPALHLVAREARQLQLLIIRPVLKRRATLSGRDVFIAAPHGEADEKLLVTDVVQQVVQRVPRLLVRPLHLIEHDDQRR